ncbi:MAG: DUF2213 domain-containing protein [Desulfomicrobium sp.]
MRYHTTSALSENIRITPEGYLLCLDVPIARTGVMHYLPEELPEEIAAHATEETVLVYRQPEDVFAPETVASFEGKPVTVGHPEDFVTPDNWKELTCGHAQNVRRGEGEASDLLLADLLITDQEAIFLIAPKQGGKPEDKPLREVSCGYDAEYEEMAPGVGRQFAIVGNHIALVPHGRCGSRCAIQDKESHMPKKKKSGFLDRLFKNPKVKAALDEAAEEVAKDEEEAPEEQQQTATDSDEKLDEILVLLRTLVERIPPKNEDEDPEAGEDEDPLGDEEAADEDPAADEDDPAKAKDSASKRKTADAAIVRRAGLLAPGLRFNTSDSACTVKRMSLRSAMKDEAVARVVDGCLRGTAIGKADCLTLDAAFMAASEVVAARNNDRTAEALAGKRKTADAKKAVTPADINALNRKFRDSLTGK